MSMVPVLDVGVVVITVICGLRLSKIEMGDRTSTLKLRRHKLQPLRPPITPRANARRRQGRTRGFRRHNMSLPRRVALLCRAEVYVGTDAATVESVRFRSVRYPFWRIVTVHSFAAAANGLTLESGN